MEKHCDLLGSGGMGCVYRVRDPQTGRPCAMKVCRTADARREAEALRSLKGAHVPKVLRVAEDGERSKIMMTLGCGCTLEDYVLEQGGMNISQTAVLGLELAMVLRRIHRRGYLYLDMKPSNIMIRRGRLELLIDYGCARRANACRGGDGGCGTRGFAAPEQFLQGAELTRRTDIYGLGRTLQYALGSRMLAGDMKRILDACTADLPEERPGSAAHLAGRFLVLCMRENRRIKAAVCAAMLALLTGIVGIGAFGAEGYGAGRYGAGRYGVGISGTRGSSGVYSRAETAETGGSRELSPAEQLEKLSRELSALSRSFDGQGMSESGREALLQIEKDLAELMDPAEPEVSDKGALSQEERERAKEYLEVIRTILAWDQEDEE